MTQKIVQNDIVLGRSGEAVDKTITFDTGDGSGNAKITASNADQSLALKNNVSVTGNITASGYVQGQLKNVLYQEATGTAFVYEPEINVSSIKVRMQGRGGKGGLCERTTGHSASAGGSGGNYSEFFIKDVQTDLLQTGKSAVATSIITADNEIVFSGGHPFYPGQPVQLTTTDTLPGGLSLATTYFVAVKNSTTIILSTSTTHGLYWSSVIGSSYLTVIAASLGSSVAAGSVVSISSAGTGDHTVTALSGIYAHLYTPRGGGSFPDQTASFAFDSFEDDSFVFASGGKIGASSLIGTTTDSATIDTVPNDNQGRPNTLEVQGSCGKAGLVFGGYASRTNQGGSSVLGGQTATTSFDAAGRHGTNYGSGGSGAGRRTNGSSAGGEGAAGIIIIEEYY